MGVGDLSVGKKMKKLGRAFYGRVQAYDSAQATPAELDDLITRTVYEGVETADPAALVSYARATRTALAGQALDRILAGHVHWLEPIQ
jgi:cytochrome b pre-mRNA-processing protein 3